ncbi:MAG: S8/S53 family peptidase [Bacteroidota bacterium]
MKARINTYLNIRTGKPEVLPNNNPADAYYKPGDEIEIAETVSGENYKDNKIWYKLANGTFVWSGGVDRLSYPWWISDFGIDEIWKKNTGQGVTVITLDTGYKKIDGLPISSITTRSVFKTNYGAEGDGLDEDGHGTLMASIIAGNGKALPGVAPGCEIIAVKILRSKKEADTTQNDDNSWMNFLNGLTLVEEIVHQDINKYYIINCSFSAKDRDNLAHDKQKLQQIIDNLTTKYRVVFVCAVGNYSDFHDPQIIPARLNNVIAVAGFSKENKNERLKSSNYWPDPAINLTCPGKFDLNTVDMSSYLPGVEKQGSSHACAYTSGLIALFLSKSKPQENVYKLISEWMGNPDNFELCQEFYDEIPILVKYRIPNKEKLISQLV